MERGDRVQGDSGFEFGHVMDLKRVKAVIAEAAPRHVASTPSVRFHCVMDINAFSCVL